MTDCLDDSAQELLRDLAPAVLCVLGFPAWGQSTAVDELFGEGVLGVKWNDGLETVRAKHPGGERSELRQFVHWTVKDGRTLFEVERRRRDTIQFAFVADRLGSVFVTFPDCDEVVGALTKSLGAYDEIAPDPGSGALRRNLGRWNGATGVRIAATRLFSDCSVEISIPIRGTPAELGLE
jgi:hypothetical protein